jgi:hypothetical protein
MDLAPEMVGNLAGGADLADGIVPPSCLEADAGNGKVVQAQEERADPALGQAQVGGVRVLCLGVAVQVEQAVGADQVRIELAAMMGPARSSAAAAWAASSSAWLKRPCQRRAPATACKP